MRTLCLMLTDHYPFDQGEEFIEQEIESVAESFSTVIVLPLRAGEDAKLTRPLPENVVPILPPVRRSSSDLPLLARYGIKALPMIGRHPKKLEHVVMDALFGVRALDATRRVREALRDVDLSGYDSVLIYSYWFFTGVAVAKALKDRELRGTRVTIVARAHAYDVDWRDSPRGYLPARPYLLEATDVLAPISDYAKTLITDQHLRFEHKLRVTRLGVPELGTVTRTRGSELWITSCSHLSSYKRVPLIAAAVLELNSRQIPVRWTHIGGRSGSDMDALKEQVASLGSSVEFTGYMPNAQVREFYSTPHISVFVNASDGEGVPVSIMEAQAASLPVVATDAGGTKEIVHSGSNGFVVPISCSASELADAIERVWKLEDEEYASMSKAAHDSWQHLSNGPSQYREWARFLAHLIGSSNLGQVE